MADSDNNNLPTYRLGVLETKVDRLQEDVKALDGRVTNLSERVTEGFTALSERLSALSERLAALYERVTDSEQRIEKRLDRLEDRQRSDFRITCRAFLAIGGLILADGTGLIAELASAVSSLFP